MTFDEKLDALIAGRLEPQEFSHADHLGVAYAALDRLDFFTAYGVLSDGLRALATRAGVPEKFSATITFAFLSEIAERKANGSFGDASAFVVANPDLAEKGFLTRRYSEARLASPLAREIPLMPDLA